tara:strand:- start:85 stop:273 length:189 start_codon:yes stop_codon:yes gene_type:complete
VAAAVERQVITFLVVLVALEAVDKAGMVMQPVMDRRVMQILAVAAVAALVVQPLLARVVLAL